MSSRFFGVEHDRFGYHDFVRDLPLHGNCLKELGGLKDASGKKRIVIATPADDLEAIMRNLQDGQRLILLGDDFEMQWDYVNDGPISLPNCVIEAWGATIRVSTNDTSGNWTYRAFEINNKEVVILGGTWYRDTTIAGDNGETRRFFYVTGADAKLVAIGATFDNGTAREGVCLYDGAQGAFLSCVFQPQYDNSKSRNCGLITSGGASAEVPGCVFDGYVVGTTTRRMDSGFGIYTRESRSVLRGATFKHLRIGVGVTLYNWGADQEYVHISDCDFIEMDCHYSNYAAAIFFNTRQGGDAGYTLKYVTIENCKFHSTSTGGALLAVYNWTSANEEQAIKRLSIRNCTFISNSSRYGIVFPYQPTDPPKLEIDEIVDCNFIGNFTVSPIYIQRAKIGRVKIRTEQALDLSTYLPNCEIGQYDILEDT